MENSPLHSLFISVKEIFINDNNLKFVTVEKEIKGIPGKIRSQVKVNIRVYFLLLIFVFNNANNWNSDNTCPR